MGSSNFIYYVGRKKEFHVTANPDEMKWISGDNYIYWNYVLYKGYHIILLNIALEIEVIVNFS